MKKIQDLGLKFKTAKQKEVYKRVVDRPYLQEPYKYLAQLFEREGAMGEAEKVLRLARERFPKDHLVQEQLAALYDAMGKTGRSIDIYKQLIKGGKSWSAYVRLARIRRESGEIEAAISLFQSVPASHPFKVKAFHNLYTLFFILSDHKRGIANLKQAIRHCGPCHRFIKDLGRLHMKAGKKKEAIEYLKEALKYQADDLDAVKLIGLAYLDMGKYGMARRYFNKILKADPGSYQAQIQLAELCLLQNRLEEAKQWIDKIRRAQKKKGEPQDSRSKLATGEYYLKKGKYKKSLEVTLDGLGETPFYYPMELLRAHSLLEAAYRGLGDEFKTGVHGLIRQALTENPDPFAVLIGLARRLKQKKKMEEAKEVLEQILLTFPGNALVLVNLAEAQFKRGMTESAIQLARAAAASPKNAFIKDRVKALKLLAQVNRAVGREGVARDCERQVKKILAGEKRS